MSFKADIVASLKKVVSKYPDGQSVRIVLETPRQAEHGDYSTNVGMILGKRVERNPMDVAEEIGKALRAKGIEHIEKVEVVKPGFINFWLSKEELLTVLASQGVALQEKRRISDLRGKRIMVEYAHPNTHKEMHIGHMRTLITGEALSRLFEASGATVFRANYQGDIGPHVAKALWGIQKIMQEKKLALSIIEGWDNKAKAHFLGEAYVRGNIDYDGHKEEIDRINKQLYESIAAASSVIANDPPAMHSKALRAGVKQSNTNEIAASPAEGGAPRNDKHIVSLYQLTRKWSIDYYEDFYKRFYTHFDRLFFEGEMADPGKKIVEENIGKVFVKENGAIIFPGEKYGLHTRVFITRAGNPTYEGKEMGNAFAEYHAFPFDLKMHIVASEQAGYFQVVFKALDLIDPEKFEGKQHHLSMGMVTLTDRKMSSRTGDILTVDWLIDQVRAKVEQLAKEGRISSSDQPSPVRRGEGEVASSPSPRPDVGQGAPSPTLVGEGSKEAEAIIEMITIGAIKYSVLKGGTGQNVAFDIEKSVALDGNSGPYLQYTFARTQSVIAKSKISAKGGSASGGKNQKSKTDWKFEIGNLPAPPSRPIRRSFSGVGKLEIEELELLRKLYQFEDVLVGAAENYAPNHIATYLFDLAQLFNLFYQKHKIIGSEQEQFRLALTASVGTTLQKALDLLGIKAPAKM